MRWFSGRTASSTEVALGIVKAACANRSTPVAHWQNERVHEEPKSSPPIPPYNAMTYWIRVRNSTKSSWHQGVQSNVHKKISSLDGAPSLGCRRDLDELARGNCTPLAGVSAPPPVASSRTWPLPAPLPMPWPAGVHVAFANNDSPYTQGFVMYKHKLGQDSVNERPDLLIALLLLYGGQPVHQ